MNFRIRVLFLMLVSSQLLFSAPSVITGAKAIAAYGSTGAYLITYPDGVYGDLYRWDPGTLLWVQVANLAPQIKQMDSLNNGTKLIGSDTSSHAQLWSGVLGYASPWNPKNPSRQYSWVLHDPVSEESRGQIKGYDALWEYWDKPSLTPSDPWNRYLPTEPSGNDRMRNMWLIDRDLVMSRYKKWERDDIDYFVTLNRGGTDGTKPFYIYAFSDDNQLLMDRITNPPVGDHNIDDVLVRQISYDEDNQNLWCIDVDGTPWQWDNVRQEWIMRNGRSEETFVQIPSNDNVPQWLREECQYYVRTLYVSGDYKPLLFIFRETHEMLLYLGELSSSDMDNLEIVVCDPPKKDHKFHNIELQPRETPQKIVRIDGGSRIQENHHLEMLLQNMGIITSDLQIGVYPDDWAIVRR